MRCKRICRELLWLARFGEFGPSSQPHLDHLSRCGSCRDEVGFDRALVQQLRTALAERIALDEPSPGAWEGILARAQAPETGLAALLRGQAVLLAARLRTATAVSAVALAAIIASSTQVAVTHPEAGSAETEVRWSSGGDQFERQPLIPRPRAAAASVTYIASPVPTDPEMAFLVSAARTSAAPAVSGEASGGDETDSGDVTIAASLNGLLPADHGPDAPTAIAPASPAGAEVPAGEPY